MQIMEVDNRRVGPSGIVAHARNARLVEILQAQRPGNCSRESRLPERPLGIATDLGGPVAARGGSDEQPGLVAPGEVLAMQVCGHSLGAAADITGTDLNDLHYSVAVLHAAGPTRRRGDLPPLSPTAPSLAPAEA